MKHIFLVHSPITFLSSVSVINGLNVDAADAIIIFFELKKIPSKNKVYTAVSIDDFFPKKTSVKKIYYYFRYFNVISRIDKIINAVTNNEKFTAYVPVMLFASKALVTNSNCVGFNFIEEGLADYWKEETLNSITAINSGEPWRSSVLKNTKLVASQLSEVLRGYNFKLQALPFSYSCYQAFKNVFYYGLSKDSFPLVSTEKKIIIPFNKENFSQIESHNIALSNKTIWIGDGAVIQNNLNEKIYLQGIEKGCIGFLQDQNINNIFIKFHRDEPAQLRQKVKDIFAKHNISFQIIPDEVILELILFESTNTTLIGIFSSLLYYAAIMNHPVYSIYNFVSQEYAKLFVNRDFNFYWDKVKLIQRTPANA